MVAGIFRNPGMIAAKDVFLLSTNEIASPFSFDLRFSLLFPFLSSPLDCVHVAQW
jgi:hypothetical protein